MYLLFEEIEGDTNLKGKAPELVETLTEVDDTICVSTHKVHHLAQNRNKQGEPSIISALAQSIVFKGSA